MREREWYVQIKGKGKGVPIIFERGNPRMPVATVHEVYMSHDERVQRAEHIVALHNKAIAETQL